MNKPSLYVKAIIAMSILFAGVFLYLNNYEEPGIFMVIVVVACIVEYIRKKLK